MQQSSSEIKHIEEEECRKARGVKMSDVETNEALAERDYDVQCNTTHKICVIKGYWIWWCSNHHQPACWCEKEKLSRIMKNINNALDDTSL